MLQIVRLRDILRIEKVSKIDANVIRKSMTEHFDGMSAEKEAEFIESMKVFQLIFSKRLPSEIVNGMMNLVYTTSHPNATSEDIENAVVEFNCILH